MGCPAPKVVKNGDGSSLLLDLKKAEKIVKAVVQNSTIPVSVKIRKGWDNNNIVAVDVAKIIEQAGASLITIHGRTRSDYYMGQADWDIIREVKRSVNIPVIGNGDVKMPEDAREMLQKTGCDGVMISRASLGNPWIFKQANDYIENGNYSQITKEEKYRIMLKHLNLEIQYKGEERGIREMRKHICYYLKGEPSASTFRNVINHLETKTEVEETLKQWKENVCNN